MAVVEHEAAALPVPYAMEVPDRIPASATTTGASTTLEAEQLWPRTWQMACRLEEIPEPGRRRRVRDPRPVGDGGAHRGRRPRLPERLPAPGRQAGRRPGPVRSGFTCPFHGWCYGTDGKTTAVTRKRTFSEHNLQPGDLDLRPVRCETWGGCAWINLDDDALPLRESIEPVATILDAWKVESLRAEWWYACPAAGELEAGAGGVRRAVPRARDPPAAAHPRPMAAPGTEFDPHAWVDAELHYLRMMSEGMDGMVHAGDVAHRRSASAPTSSCPPTRRSRCDLAPHLRRRGHAAGTATPARPARPQRARGLGDERADGLLFPHCFVLPMYSSASSYRFRPLGPEETLMEIWSMTRYPEGEEPPRPTPPEVWATTTPLAADPRPGLLEPAPPAAGLHTKGFEYMRLSERAEGHISNFHRTIDRYLAGLSHEEIAPALRSVNVNPLEMPIVDLDA